MVKVDKNGDKKAQFYLKIVGRLRDSTIKIDKSKETLVFPIQSQDKLQNFQQYPIQAEVGTLYEADIEGYGPFLR